MGIFFFIGHDNWRHPIRWDGAIDSKKFKVLRPILFFYREQNITSEDLHKFFTEKAIISFINDKFIEEIKDGKTDNSHS
jgi:hypothetical protein